MSRIHEALKKAEQEKAAAQAGQTNLMRELEVQAAEPIPEVRASSVIAEPPSRTRAAVLPEIAVPANGSLSSDAFLAQVVQRQWTPNAKTMLFFGDEESVTGTEQFRTLRSRLYAMRERMPLKTILVASALPKDGKSFVAANLAQVLSRQEGRRVLLIDGDMRLSTLHSVLGTGSTPGLGDYLLGESDECSMIQRGPMENLFFLPSGRTVEHPAELISNGRLAVLLQRIGHLFDWVVIDSPPAVPVSDASQLSRYADGVLLVVRSNATPYDTAQRAQREFHGKTLVGVVLNGTMRDGSYARYEYESYERPLRQKV